MKQHSTYHYCVLPILFGLFLIWPTVEYWGEFLPPPPKNFEINIEQKDLSPFSLSNLDRFTEESVPYYRDHISLRPFLLKSFSRFHINAFAKSPFQKRTIIGKEGWCFTGRNGMTIALGEWLYTEEQLAHLAHRLDSMHTIIEGMGVKHYIAFAPLKHHLYPEYLPDPLPATLPPNRTDQLTAYLREHTNLDIIDLQEPMKAYKERGWLYYQNDHHWNALGAMAASEIIVQHMAKDFPAMLLDTMPTYELEEYERLFGSLINMMGFPPELEGLGYHLKPVHKVAIQAGEKRDYPLPGYFPLNPESYETVKKTHRDSLPKLLFIRDSFGREMMAVLPEHFSETVSIFDTWQYELNRPILEQEQPDIMLHVVYDLFQHNMLAD